MNIASRTAPRAASTTVPATKRAFLVFVICLLPFEYVPYEITSHTVSLNAVLFVLILILGARFDVLRGDFDRIESTLVLLAVFITFVLILGTLVYPGDPGSASLLGRELTKIFSAIVLYRIGRRPELAPTITTGISLVLIGISLMGFYQLHEGLAKLIGLGYTSPRFNFATEGTAFNPYAGVLRPFGNFESPTVFGAYLAVTLGYLLWANVQPSTGVRRLRYLALLIGTVALYETQTRAAWIAIVVGAVVSFLVQPGRSRRRYMRSVLIIAVAITGGFIIVPSAFDKLSARLATLTSTGFTSNVDRLILWRGTWDAVISSSSHLLLGYGTASFIAVMDNYIPASVSYLDQAHSTYFEILYLYGAIGVLLYLALLWPVLRTLIQHVRLLASPTALAGTTAFIAFVVDSEFDNLWTSYNFIITVFLLVGVGLARNTKTT